MRALRASPVGTGNEPGLWQWWRCWLLAGSDGRGKGRVEAYWSRTNFHVLQRGSVSASLERWKRTTKYKERGIYLFFHIADDKRPHGFMIPSLLEQNTRKVRDVGAVDDWTEADPWTKVTTSAGSRRDVDQIVVRSEQGGFWHFAKAGQ